MTKYSVLSSGIFTVFAYLLTFILSLQAYSASGPNLTDYCHVLDKYRRNLVLIEGYKEIHSNNITLPRTRIIKTHLANGFFINSDTVLTTKSIVLGSDKLFIKDLNGGSTPVKKYSLHSSLDLALLFIETEFNVLEINSPHIPQENEICLLLSINEGNIIYQATRLDSLNANTLKFQLNTKYSRSGSILLSEHGNILGIFAGLVMIGTENKSREDITSVHRLDDVFVGFGYRMDHILNSMGMFMNTSQRGHIQIGIKVYEGPDGVFIKEIIHDSPAESAGLQAMDKIIFIGGQTTGNIVELHNAIYFQEHENPIEFGLLRDNRKIIKQVRAKFQPIDEEIYFNKIGIDFFALTDKMRQAYDTGNCQAFMVLSICSGSKLYNILNVKDIILIEDRHSLSILLKRLDRGLPCRVRLYRNGTIRELDFRR